MIRMGALDCTSYRDKLDSLAERSDDWLNKEENRAYYLSNTYLLPDYDYPAKAELRDAVSGHCGALIHPYEPGNKFNFHSGAILDLVWLGLQIAK